MYYDMTSCMAQFLAGIRILHNRNVNFHTELPQQSNFWQLLNKQKHSLGLIEKLLLSCSQVRLETYTVCMLCEINSISFLVVIF